MKDFYEVCKVLIGTETSYKKGVPHALVTGIDSCTQKRAASVEFDYKKVFDREDTYKDIVGFYHTHPSGLNQMSQTDIDTMKQWVGCLGKSLVCVIETAEQINGWVFAKETNGGISVKEVQVTTNNDVNYDVWFDSKAPFWDPVDFLLEGEYYAAEEAELTELSSKLDTLIDGFNKMNEAFQIVVGAITDEDE